MSHAWDNFVLGGTDVPRILSVRENFCSNPYFDENENGWVASTVDCERQVHDDAFGEYMYMVAQDIPVAYVDYDYDYGSIINGRVWLVSLRLVGEKQLGYDVTVSLRGSSEITSETITVTTTPKKVVLVATATGQTGNTITVRVTGNGDYVANQSLWFDDVYLTEVIGDYAFPQPNAGSYLRFEKINYGSNELMLGSIQEFGKRWRPNFQCGYTYLDEIFEMYRQDISEAIALFCIPHRDVDWGFLGIWDGDFYRRYAFDRFIGHKGVIPIKGIELFTHKPIYQSGLGELYIEDEIFIYG